MLKYIYIFLLLNISSALSQGGNIWYFGEYAGVNFNTPDGTPVGLTDNAIRIWEGCATVTDTLGNLMFYTDGVEVRNRNHNQMSNGSGLGGCNSSTQSAIVVQSPTDLAKFYIFTTDCQENRNRSLGFRYTTIDMNLDNGFGGIEQKNILLNPSTVEKVTAVHHSNKRDIWVIMHQMDSDTICAYLVTPLGISSPVISKVPPVDTAFDQGYFKASPNGKKLAGCYASIKTAYLYDFDNTTGVVSNPIELFTPNPQKSYYGAEFSPDCSKLYITFLSMYTPSLVQLNLNAGTPADIQNSEVLIAGKSGSPFGAVQLGPNGKIYVSDFSNNFLSVINKPNSLGLSCNFDFNGVKLDLDTKPRWCSLGLPTFVQSIFILSVKAFANNPCEGDTLYLSSRVTAPVGAVTFNWTGPNGFISSKKYPSIAKSSSSNTGWYFVTATLNQTSAIDSIYVTVFPRPVSKIKVTGNLNICEGDSVILSSSNFSQGDKFYWSNGDTTITIIVKSSGLYKLRVENVYGCPDTDSILISVFPKPNTRIIPSGNPEFCEGDSVRLVASPILPNQKYQWSTGDTTTSIIVKKAGTYKLTIENLAGCLDSTTIDVIVDSLPVASILPDGPTHFCQEDSVLLQARPTGAGYTYQWSTGDTASSILVKLTGLYKLTVTNIFGCWDTASVFVNANTLPMAKINITGLTSFCEGDSAILTAQSVGPGFKYYWSTNDTGEKIVVRSSGRYWLKVQSTSKCVDSTYIDIVVFPAPNVVINGETQLCTGDTLALSSMNIHSRYLWSNSATTRTILVTNPGLYILTGSDSLGCSKSDSILVSSVDVNLDFSKADSINFSRIYVDHDSTASISLFNNKNNNIKINSVFLKKGNSSFKTVTNPVLPASIRPGEQLTISITFAPDNIINFADSLIIEITEPCYLRFAGFLKGTGIAKMLVSLPDTSGLIGTANFCIPLTATLLNGSKLIASDNWNAEIRFDPGVFITSQPNEGKIINKQRSIGLSPGSLNISVNPAQISSFCGTLMLPERFSTPLIIEQFNYDNPNVQIIKKDGSLLVYGLCQPDLSRVIKMNSSTINISPNPASDKIELTFKNYNKENLSVTIYTINGEKVSDIKYEVKNNANFSLVIAVNNLAEGFYQLNIIGGQDSAVFPLIILKP